MPLYTNKIYMLKKKQYTFTYIKLIKASLY
jgi:hypothetical protein